MSNYKVLLLMLLTVVAASSAALASDKQRVFVSPETRVHLIELFSSEGCSSCPPADRWMAKLEEQKGLWKSFVPLNFHVDYWDRLGWVDRLANKEFTKRQWDYAKTWQTPSVYTPAFVLNGRAWKRDWRQFLARKLPPTDTTKVGQLKATALDKQNYRVEFTPLAQKEEKWLLHAALLGNGIKHKIKAGENAGKTLRHNFVVLALAVKMAKQEKGTFVNDFMLKPTGKIMPKEYAVAFWVSPMGSMQAVQATGGPLLLPSAKPKENLS